MKTRKRKADIPNKIDPALSNVVRIYVDFLEQLERNSNEGRMNFPDDFVGPIIQKSGWHDLSDASVADIFNYIRKLGGLKKADINIFFSLMGALEEENIEKILKICSKMLKSLPEEESRQFYLSNLESFKSDPSLKSNLDIATNKRCLDFFSIVLSLLFRYLFVRLFEDQNEVADDKKDYFKNSHTALAFINLILSSFSQIGNLRALADLKSDIAKGNEKAIFKAVTIDKTYLYLDEVKAKIQIAQLTGDSKFFSKLGRAISDNPLKRIGQHGKTYSVLRMFWLTGLYRLTNEELYNFFKSCDLIPPAYPYAFEKFLQRHFRNQVR